jgi:hypothetical protein
MSRTPETASGGKSNESPQKKSARAPFILNQKRGEQKLWH